MSDETDFQRWVLEHHAMIWATCFAILRDGAIADEVVQDTFMRAYLRMGQLRDGDRVGPWLRAMARNQAIDRLRRHRRELAAREAPPHRGVSPTSSAEVAIAEAFESLDEDSRALLLQFHLEGRSTQELAAQWGVTDAALRKRLSRARSVLRDEYAAQLKRWGTSPRTAAAVAAGVLAGLGGRARAARLGLAGVALLAVVGLLVAARRAAEAVVIAPGAPATALAAPVPSRAPHREPAVPPTAPALAEPTEASAFVEAAQALRAFDEGATYVECAASESLTDWLPAERSFGWSAFQDQRVVGSTVLGLVAGSPTGIEGTLVFEHVADATRRVGYRFLVTADEEGPTGASCALVRLAEVRDEDLEEMPVREALVQGLADPPSPVDLVEFGELVVDSEADERSLLEAGKHPLQLARAAPGLSTTAAGILDDWLEAQLELSERLAGIDFSDLQAHEVNRGEDGSVTIVVDREVLGND